MLIEESMMMLDGPRGRGRHTIWLMLISTFRDELPMLYELGMDVYRALKSGNEDQARKAHEEFRTGIELLVHHPIGREMYRDKEAGMYLEELLMGLRHSQFVLFPDANDAPLPKGKKPQ